MGKLVKGIHHVSLKCKDNEELQKTIAFYQDILGLETARSWGEGKHAGMMFDTGCGIVEIFTDTDTDLPQGAVRHFAFETDDVDACIEAVRKAGYQITREPEDVEITSTPSLPVRVGFCIGPVGEEIEFFHVR